MATNKKPKFKEKIVALYDSVFDGKTARANFWNEFFLIRPKRDALIAKIKSLLKPKYLHVLVQQSVRSCVEGNSFQKVNALQTLSTIVIGLGEKFTPDHCYEFLEYMFGFDTADDRISELCAAFFDLTSSKNEPIVRSLSIALLVTSLSVRNQMEKNILGERILTSAGFDIEQILNLFSTVTLSSKELLGSSISFGTLCIHMLACMLRMERHPKLIVQQMSCLDSALALDGLGYVIENELSDKIAKALRVPLESQSSSWSSFILGSSEPEMVKVEVASAALVTLLTIVKVNRNFIPVLCHWRAREESAHGNPPLATFLEYTSLVQQNMKIMERKAATRIAFITLSIITEDHFANCFLHDQSVKFRLRLHRAPARHRNIPTEEASPNTFAAWILQICCEFLVSHLMKDFPLGVHQMALGIIHRLLIYQKRSKCRLNFDWSLVLQSLVLLLKFVCSNQNSLRNRHANSDIQQLVKTALVVVNIFICCGDQIFMGTADYDKLYYELIRVTSVFDKVEQYAISQREKPSESCRGFELDNLVFNVRQIQSYFNKLLTNSQTPQQILSLIQENYSYINLRFLDGLENFVKLNQEHVIDDIVPDLIANSRKMLPFDMVVYKKLCS